MIHLFTKLLQMNNTVKPSVIFFALLFYVNISLAQSSKEAFFVNAGGLVSMAADNVRGIRIGGFVMAEQTLSKSFSYFGYASYTLPKTYEFETYTQNESFDGFKDVVSQNCTIKNSFFTFSLGFKKFILGNLDEQIGFYISADAGLGLSIDDFQLDPSLSGNQNFGYHSLMTLYEDKVGYLFTSSAAFGVMKKLNSIDVFSEIKFNYFLDLTLPDDPYVSSDAPDTFKNFQVNEKRISNSYALNIGVRYFIP
jgi:hypothetical protein